MSTRSSPLGDLLFTKIIRGRKSVEYVSNMDDIRSGKVPPPLQGARVDGHVDLTFLGPRLKGTGTAIDYANYRADGMIELHIHEEITTHDGAKISGFATGTGRWEEGTKFFQLREEATFSTGAPAYAWLNTVRAWGFRKADETVDGMRVDFYSLYA